MMTAFLARHIPAETRAEILLSLDRFLRETINDEEIFMTWLEEGVPDGTTDAAELLDIGVEEFVEMWQLAERLLNEDTKAGDFEPDGIDDDTGYNPYAGCFDWDC